MNRHSLMICVAGLSMFAADCLFAAVGWRTDATGRYPEARPPLTWSKDTNVVWSTAMPAWSNSSVVLHRGRIFVCAEPTTLVCVDAANGQILWQRTNEYFELLSPEEVARAKAMIEETKPLVKQLANLERDLRKTRQALKKSPDDQELKDSQTQITEQITPLKKKLEPSNQYRSPSTHTQNGFSSGTPVTDGRRVFALFGNGVAACYDLDGNRQWIKMIERPTAGWGQSSSPLLVGNTLVLLIGDLYALNAETGDQLWRAPARQRWGTPIHARAGEVDLVVSPGGEIVRLSNGQVIATNVSDLSYCAPIVDGGIVYFIQHGGKAIKLTTAGDGSVRAEARWETKPAKERYYASPLLHDGLIYAINQKAVFSVIDAKTGEVIHQRELDLGKRSTVYSSVTLGGRWLYVTGENGVTLVLEPGREPKQVARNELERWRSSPVFDGERMYVRTRDRLYCIGK